MATIDDYKMAYDVFADVARFAGFTDENLIKDLYTSTEKYRAEGLDDGVYFELLATSPDAPESYKTFLKNFEKVKSNVPAITTVADYLSARKEYESVLKTYNLDELANADSTDQFLINRVSPKEASDRLQYAYNSILNADDQLKAQLQQYFPNLSPKELAKTVLGVGKTVDELQKDVERAGIQAGAAQAGLTAVNVDELQRAGVNRAQAAAGFSEIKQGLQSVGAAAARAGTSVEGLQQELESEQFLGMASQRRKKLAAREQAALSGQSGTMTGSLSRQVSGSF